MSPNAADFHSSSVHLLHQVNAGNGKTEKHKDWEAPETEVSIGFIPN